LGTAVDLICANTRNTRARSHPRTYLDLNYIQHEDHIHSEIDRVTESFVDDGHIVPTIVAPREETTKFI
jgi:hypothetical protein